MLAVVSERLPREEKSPVLIKGGGQLSGSVCELASAVHAELAGGPFPVLLLC